MTSTARTALTGLCPLITGGQCAVRAAESRGTPETLRAIDVALCALPLNELDNQADRVLHTAIQAVSLAEHAEEWELLAAFEQHVSSYLDQPDGATLEHPAVQALVFLTSQCGSRSGKRVTRFDRYAWQTPPECHAWDRALSAGVAALGELTSTIGGSSNPRALDKALTAFLTAVRRAIPYAALYETRRALVEAARAYGLFVVGMRQPIPVDSRWDWERRIGTATYRFEVELPMPGGDPYGAVAVRRFAEDGTAGLMRYIPLGPDENRRRAVTEALYRI